ncbi:hypothetical protein [Spirulina sp. 06S082]|uniref:hypothetical protein n=1 Tax=Spirulina sp. 06S082 TaxID=3110248 RepID=UPI002B211FDA|nr:hypothetical protein [Spirulina sp. 06S082]MEA5472505.1 hypothetical protein [Spirulina sp. 06S082]
MNLQSFVFGTTFSAIALLTPLAPAWGQSSGYQQVERDRAERGAIRLKPRFANDVRVFPGRMSAIDFSQTDETIFYVGLADPSRVVFNTDVPLAGGLAKTIFLCPIQPLRFPNATTAAVTNLAVKTIDGRGRQRLYNFNIVRGGNSQALGVRIVPYVSGNTTAIQLDGRRSASFDDIELGLQIAIRRGYTPADDPVVYGVRQFLALARNGVALREATRTAGVDLAVLSELGKIALERTRLNPRNREESRPNSGAAANVRKKPKI